jgi:hypothetical protein
MTRSALAIVSKTANHVKRDLQNEQKFTLLEHHQVQLFDITPVYFNCILNQLNKVGFRAKLQLSASKINTKQEEIQI